MGPRPRTSQTEELPRPRLDEQLKMSHLLIGKFQRKKSMTEITLS